MCLYPKIITNRKYQSNKKNGGVIPAVTDKRTLMVPVGCTKCIECRKKKAREWQVRLLEEVRTEKNGIFVTLTFSNESIKKLGEDLRIEGYERDNEIATIAIRRFLERWRKKYKKSVKHWLVTELGHNGTENIHMHGIIWTNEPREEITRIWQYGYTWLSDEKKGWVNEQTVNYITKYVNKADEQHTEYNSKILTSPGIGKKYIDRKDAEINKYNKNKTDETYKNKQGYKMAMPIYYRNKIYTETEREKLWIEKLDKEERYVLGQKIKVSENDKEYYEALEYARAKNSRLGYGNNEINWNKKMYENEKRNIKFRERIKTVHN